MLIAPSILAADFARLGEEVAALDAAGADLIHIDVMDGHFVPNLTFGMEIVRALRSHTAKPFDVHLMIAPYEPYLEAFAKAGADTISIHQEAGPHIHRGLQTIRALGKKPGLALNPGTPASAILPLLDEIDVVLVLTVNPGFGGQSYIEASTAKIAEVRRLIGARPIQIEVDGGVTEATVPRIAKAGADIVVAGSAIFKAGPAGYAGVIQRLRDGAA